MTKDFCPKNYKHEFMVIWPPELLCVHCHQRRPIEVPQRKVQQDMKQVQTFKFDPDLIKDLNTEAKDFDTPFNRYVETLLRNHPYRIKRNITHPERKKK